LELHSQGYPDGDIAEELKVSRPTIIRRRKELGLKANRRKGERGMVFKEDEPYWQVARRAKQHIGRYISEAASEIYRETKDWYRFQISGVLEPKPLTQQVPGPYYQNPDRMYQKHIKYITDTEKSMDMVGLAGVPGPAFLELLKVYKSGKMEVIKRLAREAVETAGFVNAHATVQDVDECTPPEIQMKHWEKEEQGAMDWSPIKEWEPVKKLGRAYSKVAASVSRTGKRGRGGGIMNIENHIAFQGAMGY
jgi:hypothetical protein